MLLHKFIPADVIRGLGIGAAVLSATLLTGWLAVAGLPGEINAQTSPNESHPDPDSQAQPSAVLVKTTVRELKDVFPATKRL
ncbi:MAG: hypothetical protein HY042_08225, partial [Spirochaetia bacterium]|nr:hypothetical protein [Spirochaetia bacterium]